MCNPRFVRNSGQVRAQCWRPEDPISHNYFYNLPLRRVINTVAIYENSSYF
ncbi:unnamed protein product [Meloidogyne enterolobii]|uniref:Uncharacterized protein n=1 Tax=Meloidogyne enterolobii TaxID=390850 RepID=A0ACB0Y284_MELEN